MQTPLLLGNLLANYLFKATAMDKLEKNTRGQYRSYNLNILIKKKDNHASIGAFFQCLGNIDEPENRGKC